jgi:ankyrin repeat protein
MRLLISLIVPSVLLLATSVAGNVATTTTNTAAAATTSTATTPSKMVNPKTKVPAFFMAACRDGKDLIIEQFLHVYPDFAMAMDAQHVTSSPDDHNNKKNGGESCLHQAARNGHDGVIELMINAGSNVNVKVNNDEYGMSPLFYAISNGHLSAVKILVRSGADVNQVFEHKETGKKMTCYDVIMDMIERIGDREVAIASGDEHYYRMKEQLEDRGAKGYEQLAAAENSVNTEL